MLNSTHEKNSSRAPVYLAMQQEECQKHMSELELIDRLRLMYMLTEALQGLQDKSSIMLSWIGPSNVKIAFEPLAIELSLQESLRILLQNPRGVQEVKQNDQNSLLPEGQNQAMVMVGPQTVVYSLGFLFFQILGIKEIKKPFDWETIFRELNLIFLHSMNVENYLKALLPRMLANNYNERPFLQELKEILDYIIISMDLYGDLTSLVNCNQDFNTKLVENDLNDIHKDCKVANDLIKRMLDGELGALEKDQLCTDRQKQVIFNQVKFFPNLQKITMLGKIFPLNKINGNLIKIDASFRKSDSIDLKKAVNKFTQLRYLNVSNTLVANDFFTSKIPLGNELIYHENLQILFANKLDNLIGELNCSPGEFFKKATFPNLKYLDLSNNVKIKDFVISSHNLLYLNLNGCKQINFELKDSPKLRMLRLKGVPIQDEELAWILKRHPSLKDIEVPSNDGFYPNLAKQWIVNGKFYTLEKDYYLKIKCYENATKLILQAKNGCFDVLNINSIEDFWLNFYKYYLAKNEHKMAEKCFRLLVALLSDAKYNSIQFELDFSFSTINDFLAGKIANIIREAVNCSINLRLARISYNGVKKILKALQVNENIKCINLDVDFTGFEKKLAEKLKSQFSRIMRMQEIRRSLNKSEAGPIVSLSPEKIDDIDVEFIASKIRTNFNIEHIDFSNSFLSTKSLKLIFASLKNNPYVKGINFGELTRYTTKEEKIIDEIKELLSRNINLSKLFAKFLRLEDNSYLCKVGGIDHIGDMGTLILLNKISSITVDNNETVTIIDLSCQNITHAALEHLSEYLNKNSKISRLILDNNLIDDVGIVRLINIIKNNESIKSISLKNNKLSNYGFDALLKFLNINDSLNEIDIGDGELEIEYKREIDKVFLAKSILSKLNKNLGEIIAIKCDDIGDSGAIYVAGYIRSAESIKHVSLVNCGMSNKGIIAILDALGGNKSICSIDLTDNNIVNGGDEVVKSIKKLLKINGSITSFNINWNQVNNNEAKDEVDALLLVNSALKNKKGDNIDLSNKNITDIGAISVAEYVRNNKSIQHVNLSNCNISNKGIMAILDALEDNDSIDSINLTDNNIVNGGDEVAKSIKKVLKINKSITDFKVNWAQINNNRIKSEIESLLLVNSCLKNKKKDNIDLSNKNIGDIGAISVAEYIRTNESTKHIDLSDCGMSNKGIVTVLAALEGNNSVCSIKLAGNNISNEGKDVVKILKKTLEYNESITNIQIAWDSFSSADAFVNEIKNKLKENALKSCIEMAMKANIKEINWSNKYITNDLLLSIIGKLDEKQLQNVESIDLAQCNLSGEEGLKAILSLLMKFPSITKLKFEVDNMPPGKLERIRGLLEAKKIWNDINACKETQLVINFKNKIIGDHGFKYLKDKILNELDGKIAISVDASCCSMSATSINYLIDTFSNKNIVSLNVANNNFNEITASVLIGRLPELKNIRELNLSDNEIGCSTSIIDRLIRVMLDHKNLKIIHLVNVKLSIANKNSLLEFSKKYNEVKIKLSGSENLIADPKSVKNKSNKDEAIRNSVKFDSLKQGKKTLASKFFNKRNFSFSIVSGENDDATATDAVDEYQGMRKKNNEEFRS
jgi:Ran GTPase-activating protein (RanGAP) involved in mRNA processing and transport